MFIYTAQQARENTFRNGPINKFEQIMMAIATKAISGESYCVYTLDRDSFYEQNKIKAQLEGVCFTVNEIGDDKDCIKWRITWPELPNERDC